jgi:hypothetical protein
MRVRWLQTEPMDGKYFSKYNEDDSNKKKIKMSRNQKES